MKKWLVAIMSAALLVFAAGCVRVQYDIELNKDGTATLGGIFALNAEYFSEEDLSNEDGNEVQHYTFDGTDYIGYDISKEFESYDELSEYLVENEEEGSSLFEDAEITIDKGLFSTTYTFDATTVNLAGESTEGEDSYDASSMYKVMINLTMPGKVTELEGGEQNDDGVIEFEFNPSGVNEYHAVSKSTNVVAIVITIVVIVAVLVAAGLVCLKVLGKKKEHNI
ncbi:MAG: hypothetical protein IJ869_00065 [Clostridiales bacterium]|nr:hypothetical protein [Clostridiales bacterium]